MATPTAGITTPHTVALDLIDVPENIRQLDPEHVRALAGSIALQGVLVPVVVRPSRDRYELVAGFHRFAACQELKRTGIPVVVRDLDSEDADRAIENIASCRRRHEAINADHAGMPTCGNCSLPGGVLRCRDVGIWH